MMEFFGSMGDFEGSFRKLVLQGVSKGSRGHLGPK